MAEYLGGVLCLEGSMGVDHLVDQTAQCPVVHVLVVPLGEDDFGGEVLRCAALMIVWVVVVIVVAVMG